MRVSKEELKRLIKSKLHQAGLKEDHAEGAADVLVHADARGIHSHGAIRVEYYAERIAKGGITVDPTFTFEKTGPSSAVFDGDNGIGHVVAKKAMNEAIKMAKESGIAIVGARRISHSGTMSYYTELAAKNDLIAISICQSDPMVVPYGGAEPFYGTNPIAFAAPGEDGKLISFDMATTVQAWGKVLQARSKNEPIVAGAAVDIDGNPTTDPFAVNALLPIAGPKGYGLMMMVDILSGILLGLPFGNKVSSMYHDLTAGRNLGQLHIVINPSFFTNIDQFKKNISQTMANVNNVKPAPCFEQVSYPGQRSLEREQEYLQNGIEIIDEIYEYLISDVIHNDTYGDKDPFAK